MTMQPGGWHGVKGAGFETAPSGRDMKLQVDGQRRDRSSRMPRMPSSAASQGPSRWSTRLDSVYAVYAEMYPELADDVPDVPPLPSSGFASREDQRGTAVATYHRSSPASPRKVPSRAAGDWVRPESTGLFGGGGRGADDRETGWTRHFALNPPPPVSGYEEDLRFEEDSTSDTPTPTPLASPAPIDTPHAETEQPTMVAPEAAPSATSLRRAREQAEGAAARVSSESNEPRTAPAPAAATTAVADKVKIAPISTEKPAISEPLLSPKSAAKPKPKFPRASGLLWRTRSQKTPRISQPILPAGFIEALGMETFALQPGAPIPVNAIRPPHLRDADSNAAVPRPPRTPSPPRTPVISQDLARNPKLSPVGFSTPQHGNTSTEWAPPALVPPAVSTEASRGHRVVEAPLWAESSISFGTPAGSSSSSWDHSHGRTDSSDTSNSGFRNPWDSASSGLSTAAAAAAKGPEARVSGQGWNGGYQPAPVSDGPLPALRYRQDSEVSAYSEASSTPQSPDVVAFRNEQPLSFVQRGEDTYSVASLSPHTGGLHDIGSWRFPQMGSAGPSPMMGLSGFRNPFS
ncbi:hypothetical protein JCM8202v2_002929 [Rhodotorula sphaerocarpa]